MAASATNNLPFAQREPDRDFSHTARHCPRQWGTPSNWAHDFIEQECGKDVMDRHHTADCVAA